MRFYKENHMKTQKKVLTILIVAALLASSLFYFGYIKPRRVTPILMYHAVSSTRGSTMHVSPSNFSNQMKFLKDKGFKVISLDELVENIQKGKTFLPRTVAITFDDGYEDNYLNAFPVLEKYKMPATIFIITDYVDISKGYLKWDQVLLMMKNNIDIGGHTKSNVYLPSVSDEKKLWYEIAGCKKAIELKTGQECGYFCYPTGGFNSEVKRVVKEAGYKGACTTNRGFDKMNRDVYELNRIKVTNSDTSKPFHFRAKLSGYYNIFRSSKSGD